MPDEEKTHADTPSPTGIVMQAGPHPFYHLRARAIESYATLEQSLCLLFSTVGSIERDVAGIIFFKITSAQARNAILDKLIRRKFGTKYSLFWNSYLKLLRPIDLKRNEIVHWAVRYEMDALEGQEKVARLSLTPPNFWFRAENDPSIGPIDLQNFMRQCDEFTRLCNMFIVYGCMAPDKEKARPWLGIFQQPLIYPLPEDHLLVRRRITPETPPRSSPG